MPFNRPQLRDVMRRGTFIAEEVLLGSQARRSSLFASVVKHRDPGEAPAIARIHLFAAMTFVIGSFFFVYEELTDNWLLPYRIGCISFIVGCIAYLVAVGVTGTLLDDGLSSRVSDSIIIVAMVLFIIGCALPFHGDEEDVVKRFPLVNWLFLLGSILLFFDALKCAISSRAADGLTLGNYLDLGTTVCFVFGAILSGKFYKSTSMFVEEGMIFWLLGSCCCAVGPTRVLACSAYDPSMLPMKGDERLYGALHATLDGRDHEERPEAHRDENIAYLRSASLPSNYYVPTGGSVGSAGSCCSDYASSSNDEVSSSSDNNGRVVRKPRALP
jgi:hypothetical protein